MAAQSALGVPWKCCSSWLSMRPIRPTLVIVARPTIANADVACRQQPFGRNLSPDYSRSSSRGAVSRGECEEKDDMAAQHIGEYVSKDMAFFDEAGARLAAPQ